MEFCWTTCPPSPSANAAQKELDRLHAATKAIEDKKEVIVKAAELLAQQETDKVNAESVWRMRMINLKPFVQDAQAESKLGPALVAGGTVAAGAGAAVFKQGPGLPFKIVGGVLMVAGGAAAAAGGAIIWLKPGQKLTWQEARDIVARIKTDELLIHEIGPAKATLESLKQGVFTTGEVGDEPLRFSEVERGAQDVLTAKIAEIDERRKVPKLTVETP